MGIFDNFFGGRSYTYGKDGGEPTIEDTPGRIDEILAKIKGMFSDIKGREDATRPPTTQQQYSPTQAPSQEPTPQKPQSEPANQYQHNVPVTSDTPNYEIPDEMKQMLMEELDSSGIATEAAQSLHHETMRTDIPGEAERGSNRGENPDFITGKGWDDYNYQTEEHTKPNGEKGTRYKLDKAGDKIPKYVVNPQGGTEKSEDRGLFRINNATFYDFQDRKPELLKEAGIKSYEDMYDPMKNIRMAKIIYDEQGWKAWFAAPPELRSQEQ